MKNRFVLPLTLAAALVALPVASSLGAASDAPTTAPAQQTNPASTVPMGQAPATRPSATAAKAEAVVQRGLAFLKSQQQPDGGWQTSDRMPPAITALALKTFLQDKSADHSAVIDPGMKKLLSFQMTDGGIYKDLLANYNTAIAVSTLAASNDPAVKPAMEKAVAYMKQLQWTPDTRPEFVGKNEKNTGQEVVENEQDAFYGGWGYGGRGRGAGRPDLSNTQFTVEALHAAGVPADDPAMQKALTFVTRLQNNSETNSAAWAGNDGGFIYGPSADRKGESFAGDYTDADGSRHLRSYGAMSYAGLKSMIYAGVSKQDPRVQSAWKWVNNNWTLDEHPGMAEISPEAAKWGYNYYLQVLAKTLDAYDQPELDVKGQKIDWRVALVDKLASLQTPDGSFTGEKKYMEDNPVLSTSYLLLALQEAQKDLREHPVRGQ